MKQFLKQYLPYYKNYKKQFFFAIIGMIMVSAGTSGTAYVIKPVLDDIFINKDETMLAILPFVVILLYAMKGFGKYIQTYYISYIGTDIIRIIKDKFLFHIMKLDIKFFQNKHGGELLSRVTNDINAIQSAVSSQIAILIMESMTIVGLIFVVIYQSPKLAFFGLIVLPVIIYPLSLLAKKMKKISHQTQKKASILMSILGEIFNNIELIIANNSQVNQADKFSRENKKMFGIVMKGVKTNALLSPFMEIVGSIAAASVIIVGGKEVIDGNLTVGEFFSFMTALFMLYTPIKHIATVYNKFQKAIAANERINDVFNQKNEIHGGSFELNEKINHIVFDNISLKYGDKLALKNINLEANVGETIALVGDSGGGKSSLVNLLLRFYEQSEGEIKFNNINYKEFTFQSLRDSISIVTQRVYILNDTVAANITFGDEYNEKKVKEVLKKAYALEFVEKMENGIDTILNEFGANLSGGQRQRIAIARALYKDPNILIFDEATSALDNESESIITQVLEEISKDKITFVIAHRLSTIKNADKIAVFKAGEIVCSGSEKELLENCSEYRRLSGSIS
ncbi:ABC transporter ATP-binding protein [Arcobacter sp. 15-2]|uniref:ABC transporter ATP-binding protein n=1 Tax=Arcobacter sp. 15-2 TaxID=3374109 RepID=UPI00399CB488